MQFWFDYIQFFSHCSGYPILSIIFFQLINRYLYYFDSSESPCAIFCIIVILKLLFLLDLISNWKFVFIPIFTSIFMIGRNSTIETFYHISRFYRSEYMNLTKKNDWAFLGNIWFLYFHHAVFDTFDVFTAFLTDQGYRVFFTLSYSLTIEIWIPLYFKFIDYLWQWTKNMIEKFYRKF